VSQPAPPDRDPAGLFVSQLAGRSLGATAASIVVAEWTDPGGGTDPRRYIAPLHIHNRDDELWYVLHGALCVRLGDRDVEVGTGGAILAPRGTPHTYWNPRSDPTRYLLVMTPRIHRLIDSLHALTERDEEIVIATFRDYDSEFLGWPTR
jgi:mannose-6-phosphate isomerase-like protein (cupin superfamily)